MQFLVSKQIFLSMHCFLAFLMAAAVLVSAFALNTLRDIFQKYIEHGHKVVQIMKIEIQIKICILHRMEIDMSFFHQRHKLSKAKLKQAISILFFWANVCATTPHKLL